MVSLVAHWYTICLTVQETQIWSLGWEDPLEKEMTTHYSILAWRIPWTEEPGGLHSMWLQRVRQDWWDNTFPLLLYLTIYYIVWISCLLFSHFVTSWSVIWQVPLSMGFSRQEYCSGLSFTSSGDFPDPGIEPASCISCIGRWVLYH